MQHLFCCLAQWISVEFAVYSLNIRILMAIAQRHLGILCIERLYPGLTHFIRHRHLRLWLSASSDASALAGHNLYEIIGFVFLFHLLYESSRILGTMNHCQTDGKPAHLYRSFSYALHSTHRLKMQIVRRRILSRHQVIGCSGRCFHDAAGISEYDACSGRRTHQGIVSLIFQIPDVDSLFLKPHSKFPRGDHVVHIPHALRSVCFSGNIHLPAADLELLRRAGRYCHIDDFLRINVVFLCKICLDSRSLHADRAFCR